MSNHRGSYLLNSVLHLLDDFDVYNNLGKEKTLALMKQVRKLSQRYDCNSGEILEKIGAKLGICYQCWEYSDRFANGICDTCYLELSRLCNNRVE